MLDKNDDYLSESFIPHCPVPTWGPVRMHHERWETQHSVTVDFQLLPFMHLHIKGDFSTGVYDDNKDAV